jgi:predicted DNA-binding transcriptional regulator AlpA
MKEKSGDSIREAAAPALRFEVVEAARMLRMSRAQLYNCISDGALKPQKDGSRTYFTRSELERYVSTCG